MKQNVLNYLLSVKKKKGAGYIVLIDPDKNSENNLEEKISKINNSGAVSYTHLTLPTKA